METIILDDFLHDPIGERQAAKSAVYEEVTTHNGLEYRNISLTEDKRSIRRMERLLQVKMKESVVMYRYYRGGEEHSTFIHSDVLIADFTAILFLNLPDQEEGGLAFWEHGKLGLQWHETEEQLARRGLNNGDDLWRKIWLDGLDETNWRMTEYVPMKFNRLVLFWAPRYHSRYPFDLKFGQDVNTARLIKVFFMKAEYGSNPAIRSEK